MVDTRSGYGESMSSPEPPAGRRPAQSPPATAGETTAERPWPVRMLSAKLGEYLARAPRVWLEGQVVQITRRPGQNWAYVTLRDPDVDMSFDATVPRRTLDALEPPLRDGARVVVHAKPSFYARRGSLSLALDDVRPVGVGELLARIEHLKRVLAAEGLFDPRRKKPLPFLPRVVGLVCGRASAAERDVVENARRRWPGVRFEIREVAVQGPAAVGEVVAAVHELDALAEVDVLVITRGGGSLEDLLPFSNETLVRAVAACRTPTVSAIGHEVDTPLLDFVADLRASTPTDAAKRVVPDMAEETERLAQMRGRARTAVLGRLQRERQQLGITRERSQRAVQGRLHRAHDQVRHLAQQVRALSPASTLERGYAVVQLGDGTVVHDPAQAPHGTQLKVRVARGGFTATTTTDGAPAAATPPAPAARPRRARASRTAPTTPTAPDHDEETPA